MVQAGRVSLALGGISRKAWAMAKERAAGIDTVCEQAIAKTAVDAREWLSANPDHVMVASYTEYAERFYRAGAVRVWFDDFGDEDDEDGEGVPGPQTLVIELPRTEPEKQRAIDFFTEELEKEDTVDIGEAGEYVGERYCRFTIYTSAPPPNLAL